jgi:hypothetical protein
MKALITAFATALLVFAVAWAILETLKLGETSPTSSFDRARLKASNAESAKDKSKSSTSKRKRTDPLGEEAETIGEAATTQQLELERKISAVRQRETDLRAKNEALDLIFQDIRSVQYAVEQIQRRLTSEIAEKYDATIELARRERLASAELPGSLLRRNGDSANSNPTIALRDNQAIRDFTVLIRRMVENGSLSAAALLLGEIQERDASKVLDSIAETDRGIALRLSEIMLAGRTGSRDLR